MTDGPDVREQYPFILRALMLRISVVSRSCTQPTLCPSPDMQPLSLRLAVPRPCSARCNSRGNAASIRSVASCHASRASRTSVRNSFIFSWSSTPMSPGPLMSSSLMSPPPEPQGNSQRYGARYRAQVAREGHSPVTRCPASCVLQRDWRQELRCPLLALAKETDTHHLLTEHASPAAESLLRPSSGVWRLHAAGNRWGLTAWACLPHSGR